MELSKLLHHCYMGSAVDMDDVDRDLTTSLFALCRRFLMSDPVLREVFRADYATTEAGGATLIDRHSQPTKTYIQVRVAAASFLSAVVR